MTNLLIELGKYLLNYVIIQSLHELDNLIKMLINYLFIDNNLFSDDINENENLDIENPLIRVTNNKVIEKLNENSEFNKLSIKYSNGLEYLKTIYEKLLLAKDTEKIKLTPLKNLVYDQNTITKEQYYLKIYANYYTYNINPTKYVPKGHLIICQENQLQYIPIEPESRGIWIDVVIIKKEFLFIPPKDPASFKHGLTTKRGTDYLETISQLSKELTRSSLGEKQLIYLENSYIKRNNLTLFSAYELSSQQKEKILKKANSFNILFEILNKDIYSPFTKDALICHIIKNKGINQDIISLNNEPFVILFGISSLFKNNSLNLTFIDIISKNYIKLDQETKTALNDKNNPIYLISKDYTKIELAQLVQEIN